MEILICVPADSHRVRVGVGEGQGGRVPQAAKVTVHLCSKGRRLYVQL